MSKKTLSLYSNVLIISALCMGILAVVATSCGQREENIVYIPTPPTDITCGGAPLGDVKDQVCEAGYQGSILLVCTESGWEEKANTCEPIPDECEEESKGKINFDDHIKPLIDKHCMNCHAVNQLDTYPVAKAWAKETIDRLDLNPANQKFMPKYAAKLSVDDRLLWEKWKVEGLIEKDECASGDGYGNLYQHLDFDYIETTILNDLNKLERRDQLNSRYAVLAHKYNTKTSKEDMDQFIDGINKMINSISQEDDIVKVSAVDKRNSVFRIDLDSYKLDANDWELILNNEFFNFESQTVKGGLIEELTGSRLPWLHADNLVFTALGGNTLADAAFLYYELLDFPIVGQREDNNESDLENLRAFYMGLDFQEEIDNFDVPHLGFFGSSISINKNRLLVRAETDDGRLWSTYDTDGNEDAEQNLFEFPLLLEANGDTVFSFQASEHIFTLPNGLDAYFLSDADGNAADFAPLNTVFDNQTPGFDPTIRSPFSCMRCHANGILPAVDQIKNKVVGIPSDLSRDDIELVSELYRNNGAQLFIADNVIQRKAFTELGLVPSQPDPVNFLLDRFRKDLNLDEVAAITLLTKEDFLIQLNSSLLVRNQIGQLATGGTISFQQLVNAFPDIVVDFRLGQDPLNEQ